MLFIYEHYVILMHLVEHMKLLRFNLDDGNVLMYDLMYDLLVDDLYSEWLIRVIVVSCMA